MVIFNAFYTSPFRRAGPGKRRTLYFMLYILQSSVFLVNSRYSQFCASIISYFYNITLLLLPKLQRHFAEFLRYSYSMRFSLLSQIFSVDYGTVFVEHSCVAKLINEHFQLFIILFAPILISTNWYRLLLIHLRLNHCFLDRQITSAKSFLTEAFPYG